MFGLDWKQILHDTLANTVSGLIILAVASGALGVAGHWLLQGGVTVPGWLALPLAGLFGVLAWAAWPQIMNRFSLSESHQSHAADLPVADEITIDDLSELQIAMLQMYATAEGGTHKAHELAPVLDKNKIEVEHALEDLEDKGLLRSHHNYKYGTRYALRGKGKAFLVEHGFTK